MNLLLGADALLLVLTLVLLVLSVWAFVDALIRPTAAFPAAGKLTKPVWVGILAVCVVLSLLGVSALGLLGGAIAVATIVYLVDVRPAVRDLGSPGRWR